MADADRLSDLPDELLHQILLHLNLSEQVATSLLSRRWRSLWSRNPTLHFKPVGAVPHDGDLAVECIRRWEKPVVLYHLDLVEYPFHLGPPPRCAFSVSDLVETVEHVVIEVTRYSWTPQIGLNLRHYFYRRLTTLTLVGCEIKSLGPTFEGFPALVSLYMECGRIRQRVLSALLSTCPRLENLTMVDFFLSRLVTVSSATLKTLKMHLERPLKKSSENLVLLKDLPKLQRLDAFNLGAWKLSVPDGLPSLLEANLCSSFHHEARPLTPVPRFRSDMSSPDGALTPTLKADHAAFVSRLTDARVLQLDLEMAEVFTRCPISRCTMFNQLEELHLHGSYNIGFELIWLHIFLGRCIVLEELCIKLEPPVTAVSSSCHISPPVDETDTQLEAAMEIAKGCSLPHLKSARIIGLRGSRNEINLVKFILETASTIRSLALYFRRTALDDYDNDEDIRVNFEKEINEFPRASPDVHVMIVREPPARHDLLCPKHFEHFGYYR